MHAARIFGAAIALSNIRAVTLVSGVPTYSNLSSLSPTCPQAPLLLLGCHKMAHGVSVAGAAQNPDTSQSLSSSPRQATDTGGAPAFLSLSLFLPFFLPFFLSLGKPSRLITPRPRLLQVTCIKYRQHDQDA